MRARGRGDDGLTTLEMTLVAPALLVAVFLCLQVALWYDAAGVVRAAANQAAIGAAQPSPDPQRVGVVQADALLFGAGGGIVRRSKVNITAQGSDVVVTVSGYAPSLVVGFDWRVRATARQPIERFVPAASS